MLHWQIDKVHFQATSILIKFLFQLIIETQRWVIEFWFLYIYLVGILASLCLKVHTRDLNASSWGLWQLRQDFSRIMIFQCFYRVIINWNIAQQRSLRTLRDTIYLAAVMGALFLSMISVMQWNRTSFFKSLLCLVSNRTHAHRFIFGKFSAKYALIRRFHCIDASECCFHLCNLMPGKLWSILIFVPSITGFSLLFAPFKF